jgi:hypothetical protein
MLSRESVLDAARNPRAKQEGFSFGPFDIGVEPPEVILGTLVTRNVQTIIQIQNERVLSIKPPEVPGLPYRIDACLRDREGNVIFEIVENEWRTPSDNWDVEIEGGDDNDPQKIGRHPDANSQRSSR